MSHNIRQTLTEQNVIPDCRHCFPHIFSLHEIFISAKDISEGRCFLAAVYSNIFLRSKPSFLRRTATLL